MTVFNRGLAAVVVVAVLSGCASMAPSPIMLNNTFSREAIAWSLEDGPNTIFGNALLRTVGGDVKTCAGFEVFLIPSSDYSRERLGFIYGPGDTGFMGPGQGRYFVPDPVEYDATTRKTTCDAQGNFTFSRIPDGEYFVLAQVSWGAIDGGSYPSIAPQGGLIMQKVMVTGGETKRLVLTRQ